MRPQNFAFPNEMDLLSDLVLKAQVALLTAPWCIISLAWVSDQPTFGLFLALDVKYHVTKALPSCQSS